MSHTQPPPTTSGHPIDLARDRLIALGGLAAWYEEHTHRAIDRTVPYRWSRRGIGGIRLPTIRIGGRLFTSEEAVAWWCEALGAADAVPTGAPA